VLPERYWIPINPLLVQHGQNLCRPRNPKCPDCPIRSDCATGRALARGADPPRREDRPARRPAPRPRAGRRVVRAPRRGPTSRAPKSF